jgi:hypothetical protein
MQGKKEQELEAGRKLLNEVADFFAASPRRWAQGAFCKDVHGCRVVNVTDPEGASWCLSGALEKVAGEPCDAVYIATSLLRAADRTVSDWGIFYWNDKVAKSPNEVIDLCRRASAQ